MEKKFKASELVRITGISRKTIDNYLKSGKLSSIVEGGRKFVTVSEVLRVFPHVDLTNLEEPSKTSSNSPLGTPSQKALGQESTSSEYELITLKARVSELEAELVYTKKLLEVYEAQINDLRQDKERLESRHNDYVSVVELLKRGLPLMSSPKRSRTATGSHKSTSPSTPPMRDKWGRFVSSGAEVEVVEVEEV